MANSVHNIFNEKYVVVILNVMHPFRKNLCIFMSSREQENIQTKVINIFHHQQPSGSALKTGGQEVPGSIPGSAC